MRTFPSQAGYGDPEITAPDAAPFGDGVSNRFRYAFDIPPEIQASPRLPRMSAADGVAELRFPLLPERAEAYYLVESSTDLEEWEVVFDSRVDQPSAWDGDIARIVVGAEAQSSFLRVRVALSDE